MDRLESRLPYPGLRAFKREETDLFFGRENCVDAMLDRLAQTRFLAVLGASGSGKSSLVRTGLFDALDMGFMRGGVSHWKIIDTHPGEQPLANLAKGLAASTGNAADELGIAMLRTFLKRGPRSIVEWCMDGHLPRGWNLLLLVDQFEELFRYGDFAGREEAEAFAALLLESATAKDTAIYVAVTMRSEYLGACTLIPGLAERINAGLYLTPRMSRDECRAAIIGPANVMGFSVEPRLVNRLLNDMESFSPWDDGKRSEQLQRLSRQADQLPLMQHALNRLWLRTIQQASESTITLTMDDYDDIGGLHNAIDEHGKEIIASLEDSGQQWVETLFRALVDGSSSTLAVRRPCQLSELVALANGDRSAVVAVLDAFRGSHCNFIRPNIAEPLADHSIIDISHESLIRQWPVLKLWTEREIKSAAIYRRLKQAALLHESEEGHSYYRTPELENALEWERQNQPTAIWAKRYGQDFDLAMAFLRDSERQHLAEEQQERRAKQREIEQAHFKVRLIAGALFLTLALMGWAYMERNQRMEELFQSRLSDAPLLVRGEDYAQAKRILDETDALDRHVEPAAHHARNLLRSVAEIKGASAAQVLAGSGYALYTLAISPDGQFLVAGGEHGTVAVYDAQTGKIVQCLQGHTSVGAVNDTSVRAVAFTPSGQLLVSAGDDGKIIVWRRSDKVMAKPTPGTGNNDVCPDDAQLLYEHHHEFRAPDKVAALSVSPNGQWLASAGLDQVITLWGLAHNEKVKVLPKQHDGPINKGGLAFSPNGRYLASASVDRTAVVWDLSNNQSQRLAGHTDKVLSLSFSADSTKLATVGADKTVRIWDVNKPTLLRELNGHQQSVWAVVWLGDYLLTGSADRSIRLWDTRSGITLRVLQGHEAGLAALAIHAGQLWSVGIDGSLRRWPLTLPFQQLLALSASPTSVAILPSLAAIAVGYGNGGLALYDTQRFEPIWQDQSAHREQINDIAASADGAWLATGSSDATAKLWQIASSGNALQQPREFSVSKCDAQELHQASKPKCDVQAVALAPDASQLAIAVADGRVGLYPLSPTNSPGNFFKAHQGIAESVGFSPDGVRLITSGNEDRSVKQWDLHDQTSALTTTFRARDGVLDASISPDGQYWAGGGRGATLFTACEACGETPYYLFGHEQVVFRAQFAPDSRQLATVSVDASVKFWNLDPHWNQRWELFSLALPTKMEKGSPLWDMDFRCANGACLLAVPLANKHLQLYRLAYEGRLREDANEQKRQQYSLWRLYMDLVGTFRGNDAPHAAQQALNESQKIANTLRQQFPGAEENESIGQAYRDLENRHPWSK